MRGYPLQLLTKQEHAKLMNSGMFFVIFPDATGDDYRDIMPSTVCCCGGNEKDHGYNENHSFVSLKFYLRKQWRENKAELTDDPVISFNLLEQVLNEPTQKRRKRPTGDSQVCCDSKLCGSCCTVRPDTE